jgi:Zn-dependent protease with chaperone function
MKKNKIKTSPGFKTQATLAIVSIAFFAVTYMVILGLAVGLTALCIYGGIMFIVFKPMPVTIVLGIGLASMGLLVLFFLVKFIFSSNKIDRSHLREISKTDEPRLFKLIDDIVNEVDTDFPKKVYLSKDVNAAVFYDSSFWSMFFPIKKNLQIGMGLVNTVTESELKGILAHEFGHFSQKSMKLGSYVYNVNQVIFNLLYENESYEKMIQRWVNVSGYFLVFVILAGKITEGIKWVLRKLYGVVNKNYMGLSREMEFHADEIAASVTGFGPIKSSLLRMTLADHAFDRVLTFYEGKIADNLKSENIYREHTFVMNFLAEYNNFPIVNGFPEVTAEELNRFNKSKLVIKDQWASHPSTDERIERLEKTNFALEHSTHFSASEVFRNIEETQRELTDQIFKEIHYQGETTSLRFDGFQKQFTEEFYKETFSKIYNGYYDNKNPTYFEISTDGAIDDTTQFEELFSDQKIDLVYTAVALQNDVEALKQIGDRAISLKTFDYDGRKYKRNECYGLLIKLGQELERINSQIKDNDIRIFRFFEENEKIQDRPDQLKGLYRDFFEYDRQFDSRHELFTKLSDQLQFVNSQTPYEEIISKFIRIEVLENKLKDGIRELMEDGVSSGEITKEIKGNFDSYLSGRFEYFSITEYNDENLNILFTALNNYAYLLSRGYFLRKKKLLTYQEGLINTTHSQVAGWGQ